MTDEELTRLAEAATPGPWHVLPNSITETSPGYWNIPVCGPDHSTPAHCYGQKHRTPNADFIAAARDAVPRLLAEKVALRKQLGDAAQLLYCCDVGEDAGCGCRSATLPELVSRMLEEKKEHRVQLLAEKAELRAENERLRESPQRIADAGPTCPEHGCPLVRIRYANAHSCPECLCRERDQEILENEEVRAEVARLQALVNPLADRVAAQSDLLSRKAEKTP
jgi:hypothetical protein